MHHHAFLVERIVDSELAGIALRSGRDCALAFTDLRLAAAGLGLGAARNIPVGGVTPARDWHLRKDYVGHFAFRSVGNEALDGIRAGRLRLQPASQHRDRLPDTTYSGKVSEHAGSLDRTRCGCGIPRRRGPSAPIPRTNLIRMHA